MACQIVLLERRKGRKLKEMASMSPAPQASRMDNLNGISPKYEVQLGFRVLSKYYRMINGDDIFLLCDSVTEAYRSAAVSADEDPSLCQGMAAQLHVYWWIIGSCIGLCLVVIMALTTTLIRFVDQQISLAPKKNNTHWIFTKKMGKRSLQVMFVYMHEGRLAFVVCFERYYYSLLSLSAGERLVGLPAGPYQLGTGTLRGRAISDGGFRRSMKGG